MAFTPSQKQRLDRRTTPSSRQRLAEKLRERNQKRATVGPSTSGAKPGLGAPPVQRKTTAAPAKKPVGRSSQPDSTYYANVDLADREAAERLGQLEGQEQAVKHDFGIEDPTNPFSRVEGLKRMFLQRFRGASAGLAARGHLYSGQHERALARTRRDEEEARAGLRSQYENVIGQIGAAKAGVKFDTEEQRQQAFEDWLARAPESEAADASVSTGSAPSAAAVPPTPPALGASPQARGLYDPLSGSSGKARQVSPNKAAGSGRARGPKKGKKGRRGR